MNATFLTLVKPVHFPVSCSLHTWQKWRLCFQLIQDNQKNKHCRWIILSRVLQEYTETWNASTNDWLCTSPSEAIKLQSVWSRALEATQDLGSLRGHGQTKDEELLVPLTITKAQTPVSLLKLIKWKCKMSSCWQNCSCSNTGLACTEGCFCMAESSFGEEL